MFAREISSVRRYLNLISMSAVCIALAGPSLAAVKPGQMNMSQKNVNGQIQISGSYGAAWTEAEIRQEASSSCKAIGQALASFQLGDFSSRKGQSFFAVCK